MSSFHLNTTIQYRIDSIVETLAIIQANQKLILKLLNQVTGVPNNLKEISVLRDNATNTPPPSIIRTREQSTQSPINRETSPNNGEEFKNDPIYARATQIKPYSCPADS